MASNQVVKYTRVKGGFMEYDQLIQSVKKFTFIGGNEERADAAVKASMGLLASRMSEQDAKEFANYLPEPLTLNTLRSHQQNPNRESLRDYFQIIATQFNTDAAEAQSMVEAVLHAAKESLSPQQFNSWKQKLPAEWARFLDDL